MSNDFIPILVGTLLGWATGVGFVYVSTGSVTLIYAAVVMPIVSVLAANAGVCIANFYKRRRQS